MRHLALETLESRALLATIPAVIPQSATAIAALGSAPAGSQTAAQSQPSIAIDPTNPARMVAVWTVNNPNSPINSNQTSVFIQGQYTTNGGASWSALGGLGAGIVDFSKSQTNGTVYFSQITDASVAFDAHGNFYVLESEHGSDYSAGEVLLQGYHVDSGGALDQFQANSVVYRWSGTGTALQPAYRPSLAVDANKGTFTDGTYTQSDPAADNPVSVAGHPLVNAAGSVYVTYAVDFTATNGTHSQQILLQASSDAGQTFSNPVVLNSGANVANPKAVVTQGRPNDPGGHGAGYNGGQVTTVWDDISSLNSSNQDQIEAKTLQPGFGVVAPASQPYPALVDALAGTPSSQQTTTVGIPVNVPANFSFADLSVSVALLHPSIQDLKIVLQSPDGASIILLNNRLDTSGNATNGTGPSGANLGLNAQNVALGTIFSDSAPLSINQVTTAGASTVGTFQAEGGSLDNTFKSATINGTWQLLITDYHNNGTPTQSIQSVSLRFTSGLGAVGGEKQVAVTNVRGATGVAAYPNAGSMLVAPNTGVGPSPAIAADNTLGATSPYQGRIYVAYVDRSTATGNPADNTDVKLSYSDDGGLTWKGGAQINDDNGQVDGFSQGDRPQFQPSLAVDPVTGTLVASWYDARYDAARARAATFVAASIDGGKTFSSNQFINPTKTAIDAVTKSTYSFGPIPDNQSANAIAANGISLRDTTFNFGDHQGLAVYNGVVYPVWAGDQNGGADGNQRQSIYLGRALIANGPRIVSGDSGVVPGGSLSSFSLHFDRPVFLANGASSLSFVNGNGPVTLSYTDPNTGVTSLINSTITVSAVTTAADPFNNGHFGYTNWTVSFTAQTAVGAYSYVVSPQFFTQIRTVANANATQVMDQNADTTGSGTFQNPDTTSQSAKNSTLPLIIPGPHVVSTSVSTQTVNSAGAVIGTGTVSGGDNDVYNGTPGQIIVPTALNFVFDRSLDTTTITPASVLRIFGPAGLIAMPAGGYTVSWKTTNVANDTVVVSLANLHNATEPTQPLSLNGTYTAVLGSGIKDTAGHLSDNNENAGVYRVRGSAGTPYATSPPISYAQHPETLPLSIPDATSSPSRVISTIVVPPSDTFAVQKVTLQLNITHPYDPDLKAWLLAPGASVDANGNITGKGILLFANVGGTTPYANFNNTTFDDSAAGSINLGGPPFYGSFRPADPKGLANLNGVQASGTWTLVVEDDNPGNTGALNSWSMTLYSQAPSSGLGEPVADQATGSFRIFNVAPTDPHSTTTWTSIGPAPIGGLNGSRSGRIGGLAVDPSDPSGNTVYVGGASGGVWKTTNFLTTSANGPTYVPLTDFGPTSGVNIGAIAVFGRNNDPNQSIVFAATGEGDTKSPGRGFLRSFDGGATWEWLDSTANTGPFAGRDHLFSKNGVYAYKMVVDPVLNSNNQVTVYAALSGSDNANGIWRSDDSGTTWTRVRAGQATDIVLDPSSGTGANNGGGGNLQLVYAAFRGEGVFVSPNRGSSWYLMDKPNYNLNLDPLIQDGDKAPPLGGAAPPITVSANGTPNGAGTGRILLAKPALVTNDPTKLTNADKLYQGWLYALVMNGNSLGGLYMTKDFGQNWTKIHLPDAGTDSPSNNESLGDTSQFAGQGDYDVSFAIDPTNPNIVYIGGSSDGGHAGFIRVDTTGVYDAHTFAPFDNNRPDGGKTTYNTYNATNSPFVLKNSTNPYYLAGYTSDQAFINLFRDPNNPFTTSATLELFNGTTSGSFNFNNTGANVKWIPFNGALGGSTDQHRLLTIPDPLNPGHARLIIGDDQGVFTGVDINGTISSGTIGNSAEPFASRNGNLALTQFYYGALQPSEHIGGSPGGGMAYYGGAQDDGRPSTGDILGTGSISSWGGPGGDYTGVATDQTGTGTVYQFVVPADGGSDFFTVNRVGRTQGLNNVPGDPATEWGNAPIGTAGGGAVGVFAVNPVNGNQILIAGATNILYRTEDQGNNWFVIGNGSNFDNTFEQALAFGSHLPGSSVGVNDDNFIYVGTNGGHIYVTTTGGAGLGNAWTDISSGLNGAGAIMKIIPNPTPGSHEAYAVSLSGVWHVADSLAPGASWEKVTGNLFNLTTPAYGVALMSTNILRYLTSMQVDWRYMIPHAPGSANSGTPTTNGTYPILYVGGQGGVFRSLDGGGNWTLFPTTDPNLDASSQEGGYLPVTRVSDLNIAVGNVNYSSGRAQAQAGDPSLLLATTYGRGQFVIRLAPMVLPNPTPSVATSIYLDPTVPGNPAGTTYSTGMQYTTSLTPTVAGLSEQSAFGNTITVTMYDLTGNPAIPVAIGTAQTDGNGKFSIKAVAGHFTASGIYTVGLQAKDQSGTIGNMAKFTFVIDTPPAAPTGLNLDPLTDSANLSPGASTDKYTNFNNADGKSPLFDVGGVLPGATVYLLRASRTNGVAGPFQVVGQQLSAAGGAVTIADTNQANGGATIPDTPTGNNPADTSPPQSPAAPFPDDYIYAAYQVDTLDVQGATSTPSLHVIVDTTQPLPPTGVSLDPSSDSGRSNSDNYTNANNSNSRHLIFNIDGVEPHATVQLVRTAANGSSIVVGILKDANPTGPNSTVQVEDVNGNDTQVPDNPPGSPVNSPPPAGNPYVYSAVQIDLAGNPSQASSTPTFGNRGAIVLDGTDADNHGDYNPATGQNEEGWLYMQKVLDAIQPNVTNGKRVLVALGPKTSLGGGNSGSAVGAIGSAFTLSSLPSKGWTLVYVSGAANIDAYLSGRSAPATDRANNSVGTVSLGQTGFLYITTVGHTRAGGGFFGSQDDLTNTELSVIDNHGTDIAAYVNGGGGLYTQAESALGGGGGGGSAVPYGWLSTLFAGLQVVSVGSQFPSNIQLTAQGQAIFPGLSNSDLSGGPWHNYFTGTVPSSLAPLFTDTNPADLTNPNDIVILGLSSVGGGAAPPPVGFQVIVDSTPPVIPGLVVDPATVSASINGVTYTNHNNSPTPGNAPVFDVSNLEPNALVNLYRQALVNGVPTGAKVLVNSVISTGGSSTIGDVNGPTNGSIPDGVYQYTVEQVDLAGNTLGDGSPVAITIDTGPPIPPTPFRLDPGSDSGYLSSDRLTRDNNGNPYPAPVFDAYGIEANATVQLWRDVINPLTGQPSGNAVLVNTIVNAAPDASKNNLVEIADTNAGNGRIADGNYYYYAVQIDLASNRSNPSTGERVTIDSQPPAPNPFIAPNLDPLSDTGQFNNDHVTQNNNSVSDPASLTKYAAPMFDVGTAAVPVEAGSEVDLYRILADPVTGRPIGATPILVSVKYNTSGGIVKIADINLNNSTIPDGTYDYFVRLVDLAGNATVIDVNATPYQTVVIKSTTPALPQPFNLDSASDTGVSSTDRVTQIVKLAHPVFDVGGVLKGATLKLYRAAADPVTGQATGPAILVNTVQNVQPGGSVTIIDPTNAIPDGKYVYTIQQVDLSGNIGPVGGAITVEYDTTAPPAALAAPGLDLASRTLPVTSPAYATQTSSLNPIFDVKVNVTGFDVGSKLSLVRDGKTVYPVVSLPSSPDSLTNYSIPAAVAPATSVTLQIQDPGDYIPGTSPAQFTPLSYGVHTYQVYLTDQAGNTSVLSAPVQITIASDPPGTLTLDPGSDSGRKGDNITNSANPTFDVTGVVSNGKLKLLRNGLTVQTISTGPGGTIQITDPGPLSNGQYTYTAQQTDSGGMTSPPGPPLTITIDMIPPVAPTQFKLDPNSANDTGLLGDNLTSNTTPTFDASGITPGATVNLFRDGVMVATLPPVLAGGTVQITDPGDLVAGSNPAAYTPVPNGPHTYMVQQVSQAGNQSPGSASLKVTIDATVPEAPAPLTLDPASHRGSTDPNTTSMVNPVFDVGVSTGTGALLKGATLRLYRFNGVPSLPLPSQLSSPWQVVATVSGLAGGTATIQDPGPLGNGVYTYAVVQTNVAGTGSPPSAPLVLTINTTAPLVPTVPTLSLDAKSDTGLAGDGRTSARLLTIDGTTDPYNSVTVYDVTAGGVGSGKEKQIGVPVPADAQGDFQIVLPSAYNNGVYKFAATATNFQSPPKISGATNPPFVVRVATVAGDYVGNGKASLEIFRRTNPTLIQWFVGGNAPLASLSFGSGRLDIPVSGDFYGLGKNDPALYRPSGHQWIVQQPGSTANAPYTGRVIATFGGSSDIPVPGNYFGNNVTYPAVYRPDTGQWFALSPGAAPGLYGAGVQIAKIGGLSTDVPAQADFGNTGHDEPAVYRNGLWIIQDSTFPSIQFGGTGDIPVPGVYDAPTQNRAAEPAVWRASTGQFFVGHQTLQAGGKYTLTGQAYQFAIGDIPVPADWDGNGLTEPAVYRPSTNQVLVYGPNDDPAKPPRVIGTFGGPYPTNVDIPAIAPYKYRALTAAGQITAFSAAVGKTESSPPVTSPLNVQSSPATGAAPASVVQITQTVPQAVAVPSRVRPNQLGPAAALHTAQVRMGRLFDLGHSALKFKKKGSNRLL